MKNSLIYTTWTPRQSILAEISYKQKALYQYLYLHPQVRNDVVYVMKG